MSHDSKTPQKCQSPDSRSEVNLKLRVAAYCRVSTQQDDLLNSLENQIEYYLDTVAKKPDWELVGMYTDKGRTGTNMNKRPGFLRLLRHCEEGKIDVVLTKSISRFSRNTQELLDVINKLRSVKVDVHFEKEGIKTATTDNDFIITVYAALAQQEAVNNAQNIEWGYHKRFLQGIPKFDPILGYSVEKVDGNLVISVIEHEATLVKEIFDAFLNGVSLTNIARSMMARNVLTKNGNHHWNANYVKYTLRNQRYVGDTLARAWSSSIPHLTGNPKRRNDILIKDSHPAIIDQKTFSLVQEILDSRQIKKKNKKRYALTRRVTCGFCGSRYNLNYNHKEKRAWICSNRVLSQDVCNTQRIWEYEVNDLALKAFIIRFGSLTQSVFQTLAYILDVVNATDTTEQRRLEFYRSLVAARKQSHINESIYTIQDRIKTIEKEFIEFETHATQIEEDRVYREQAESWLERNIDSCKSWEKIPLEVICAWMKGFVVFSKNTAIIQWCDGQSTLIGDCPKEWPLHTIDSPTKNKSNNSSSKAVGPYQRRTIIGVNQVFVQGPVSTPSTPFGNDSDANYRIRVCAYCRVSTEEEKQIGSIAAQIGYYTHLIMKNPNWVFAGIYADIGASGTGTAKRSEFLRMIDLCKAGRIDRIITKSISRFSRNTVDCLEFVRMLKGLPSPVGIWFEQEKIDTLHENSEFTLSLHSSIAQEESLTISENLRWSRAKLLERGIYNYAGVPCYGYEVDGNKNWQICQDQARVIRRIYSGYLTGKTTRDLARELTQNGVISPIGKQTWWPTFIKKVLKNEAYIGSLTYQKTYVQDPLTHKIVKNNGELPKYLIEDHHEAIIDIDTWEKVQNRMKSRSEEFASNCKPTDDRWSRNEFSKVFYCGSCGNVLGRTTRKLDTGRVYRWRCSVALKRKVSHTCHEPSYREEAIEQSFMTMLQGLKNTNSWIEESKNLIDRNNLSLTQKERLHEIEVNLQGIYKEIHNTVKANPVTLVESSPILNNLVNSIFAIKKEWNTLHIIGEDAEKSLTDLEWFISELDTIPNFDPLTERIPFRPDIFERVVSSGEVRNDKSIVYKLTFGTSVKSYGNDRKVWKLPLKG